MKKEWLLTLGSVVISVLAALGLLRWLAPGLLGYAVDQQLVQVSEKVPPYYDNIFRLEDQLSQEFILKDPVVVSRAKPLFPDMQGIGPNDILGFRNRNVPNQADVVVIGDSQTYGNNAPMELNWPSVLQDEISEQGSYRVYNMSVGAWGSLNYLEITRFALRLRPRVIVVAFYTGNDPYSDFRNAYSNKRWSRFRVDPTVGVENMQKVVFPPPSDELWTAQFKDGQQIEFSPKYRYISNRYDDPVVRAGYEIMASAAKEIAALASEHNVATLFTIIPTKELAYAEKPLKETTSLAPEYAQLIVDELRNIDELAEKLSNIPNSQYVDVVAALQEAAKGNEQLYPENLNGHPIAAGYSLIGKEVAPLVADLLPERQLGAVAVIYSEGRIGEYQIHTKHGKWLLKSQDLLIKNGWTKAYTMNIFDVTGIPYLGIIDHVDVSRFAPEAIGTVQ